MYLMSLVVEIFTEAALDLVVEILMEAALATKPEFSNLILKIWKILFEMW